MAVPIINVGPLIISRSIIEAVVAIYRGGDVNHDVVARGQLAAGPDHFHDLLDELRVGWPAKERWRTGVNPRFVFVGTHQTKRPDPKPLRTQIALLRADGKTVLIHG